MFLSVSIGATGMKAFGPEFKSLYDTGLGRSSGMSEGLGSITNGEPKGNFLDREEVSQG